MVCSTSLYSEIIDQVAIVRPILAKDAKQTYLSVSNWLENSRNPELAEQFIQRSEDGGFGSGFLVSGKDSKTYIVTNFHVIAQADSANVEFQDHNGNSFIFTDCPVIIADENRDLAILYIDSQQHDKELIPLSLNGDLQVEGTDVWTAGFPGFGSDPLWQLAKGSVTNRKARTTELDINGLEYVIQHSSIIDGGSSGGPLLLKENKDFTVVGVNTWSARGRDNTYFSIPSKDLSPLISEIPEALNYLSDETVLFESLEASARSFAEEISSIEEDFVSHRRFISHQLVFSKGWQSYYAYRKTLDKDEKEDWDSYFFYGNPYDVMKESVYKDIRSLFSKDDEIEPVQFLRIVNSEKNDASNPVTVVFSNRGNEIITNWILELGSWRMSSISYDVEDIHFDESEKSKTSSFIRDISGRSSIAFGSGMTFSTYDAESSENDSSKISFGLDLAIEVYTYDWFGWFMGIGFNDSVISEYDYWFDITEDRSALIADLNMGVKLLLPLSLSKGNFYLTPYAAISLGAAIDIQSFSDIPDFFIPFRISGGAEVAFGRLKDSLSYGIDLSYTKYYTIDSLLYSSDTGLLHIIKPSIYARWFF
jgi:hypothetical protein